MRIGFTLLGLLLAMLPGVALSEDASSEDDVPLPDLERGAPSKTHRTVYVETDEPVDLYRVIASGSIAVPNGIVFFNQSKSVCGSPCGESIDVEDSGYFFVAGEGFPASRHFRIDHGNEPITVNVETGSNGGLVGGITLSSLGGASILAGGTTILLGGLFDDEVQIGVGGALAGVGVAGLVGGILLASGSLTDIELQEGAPAARPWLGEF